MAFASKGSSRHVSQHRRNILRPVVLAMLLATLIARVQDVTAASPPEGAGISALRPASTSFDEAKRGTRGVVKDVQEQKLEQDKLSRSRRGMGEEENGMGDQGMGQEVVTTSITITTLTTTTATTATTVTTATTATTATTVTTIIDTTRATTKTGTTTTSRTTDTTTTAAFPAEASCYNSKSTCKDWVLLGYCAKDSTYRGFMEMNCMLACTFCGDTTTSKTTTTIHTTTVITTATSSSTRTSTTTLPKDTLQCISTADCCPSQDVVCKVPDGCPSDEPHCWPRCLLSDGTVSPTFVHGCPDDLPASTTTKRAKVTIAVDIDPRFGESAENAASGGKWSIPVAILMVGLVVILAILVRNQRRRREGVIFFGGYERGGERDYGLASYNAARDKDELSTTLLEGVKFWK